jgi:hypothetical protein
MLVLVSVLMLPPPARAQQIVEDPFNLIENTIQAIQLILTVANQLLELTGLDEIVIQDGYAEDIGTLTDMVTEGTALMGDVGTLKAELMVLFDLHTATNTSLTLEARLVEVRQTVFTVRVYALRTQALLVTLTSTARHLQGLVAAIGDYVGNKQGTQSLNQSMAVLNKTQATLATQTAAYQHAEVLAKMEEPLIIESLRRIHAAQHADWPGYQSSVTP